MGESISKTRKSTNIKHLPGSGARKACCVFTFKQGFSIFKTLNDSNWTTSAWYSLSTLGVDPQRGLSTSGDFRFTIRLDLKLRFVG